MVADPQAYVDRLAGMRDFARYAQTAPRRIGAQQALGKTLDEAIAIEHRSFAAIATGDPFRTWRKLTEDQTTAPTNPAWQGWVRVPSRAPAPSAERWQRAARSTRRTPATSARIFAAVAKLALSSTRRPLP